MIDSKEIEKISAEAGELRAFRARKYVREKRINVKCIKENEDGSHTIEANVKGSYDNSYDVIINEYNGKIVEYSCNCMDESKLCKHILATIYEIYNKYNDLIRVDDNTFKYKEFTQLINCYSKGEEKLTNIYFNDDVQIVPVIKKEAYNRFSVSFKIGVTQLYKIRSLVEFCDALESESTCLYGKKLEFIHKRNAFCKDCLPLLDFIIKYGSIIKYTNNNLSNYYGAKLNEGKIFLNGEAWDEMFNILNGKEIEIDGASVMFEDDLDSFKFEVEEISVEECKLINKIKVDYYIEGKEYLYAINDEKFERCIKNSTYAKNILKIFSSNATNEIVFSKKELPDFFALILPKAKELISLDKVSDECIDKYKPGELGVKIFLDIDKNRNIICDVKFCYGDVEFNPFGQVNDDVIRNRISEENVKKCFQDTGFKINDSTNELYMNDDEKIYDFLTVGINYYMDKFEVLVTNNFKTIEIRQPRIGTIGVKIENNLLNVNFSDVDFELAEIKEIMQNYKLKKKYHRLKNGAFISLEDNADIKFIDDLFTGADIDFKNINKNEIKMPIHRSLYLNKLLEGNKNKNIVKDANFKKVVGEITNLTDVENIDVPNRLKDILRFYQVNGYKWLKTLDSYGFGGVLADDMGLGKTLQVISVLLNYKENKGEKTSIVVCPSSLVLNWDREIKKFAPVLNILIVSGNAIERKEKIGVYKEYDAIITSYDSLKRDIDEYDSINADFKYVIADEAQYIKNGNTQNAKSLKSLRSDIRFALTGTPIENSLAELWSIFDYIMPGYLFSYNKFKKNYEVPIIKEENANYMEKLKMLIEPFILRRNKKEVLTELPEKTVTLLYNDMEENQKKIYLNYLMQTKKELMKDIDETGFEKSKIKILALLTRLRQICCHPSLFIDNYYGESGKLDQCMEIINEAVAGGHKILLFSSYTSMFDIIETKLQKDDIKYYKLTGKTKVDERIKLVEEFNKNSDIKVFLISLKAGGTGLNLTGADVVIHYDPWWNIAAENQATDRAYRIGQKNNVQVYKLITKDSIEEKIQELQEKKSKLIDDVLSTEETFINKLSKEDILALFD